MKTHYDEIIKQKHLVDMLKAKRIEQGKNLEEVSEGICSVSYLSRIENNQVRLQEPYLSMLFERLNIKYDQLVENRSRKIFIELLEKHYTGEYDEFFEKTIQYISLNIYLEVERRIIFLFDSVIKKRYYDSYQLIQEIEPMVNVLTEEQLNFYIYVITLYYYNTNQVNQAYNQMKLIDINSIEQDLLYWAIYELRLCIYFKIGFITKYVEEMINFEEDAPMKYFSKIIYKHKFKKAVLDSKVNLKEALTDMESYKNQLEMQGEMLESYYYHLGLIYLLDEDYDSLFKCLNNAPESSRIMQVFTMALIKNLNTGNQPIIDKVNNYGFSKFDEISKNLLAYFNHKKDNVPIRRLQVFLKLHVFSLLRYSFDQYLYEFLVVELCNLSIRCSKYKEACGMLLKSIKTMKKELLSK